MKFFEKQYRELESPPLEYHDESRFENDMFEKVLPGEQRKQNNAASLSRSRWTLLLTLNIMMFSLSVAFFLVAVRRISSMDDNANNNLLRRSSFFSPIFDRLDIPLKISKVNGTLLNTPHSIYRDDPSPEVDAAWDRISIVDTVAATREDVMRVGKDPTIAAKYPDEYGLGSDAYIVEIDVFHQIHCLNTLRKEINFEYYFGDQYPDRKNLPKFHKIHISHCLYLLLQNLMCQANVDVITHKWVEGQPHPFPDFNINHKCRDFDAVLDYQTKNHVDFETYKELRIPEGMEPEKMSEEFLDLWKFPPRHAHQGSGI